MLAEIAARPTTAGVADVPGQGQRAVKDVVRRIADLGEVNERTTGSAAWRTSYSAMTKELRNWNEPSGNTWTGCDR